MRLKRAPTGGFFTEEMRLVLFISLFFLNIALSFGQTSKPCYSKIYEIADTLPVLVSSLDKVLEAIKNEIVIPDSLKNREGVILIKYVVNCQGHAVNLRTIKLADYDGKIIRNNFEYLTPNIYTILKRELLWRPARQAGKAIDFLHIFSIKFNNGEISINTTGS